MTLTWAADMSQADAVAAGFQNADYNRQTQAGNGASSGLPWPMPIALAPDNIRSAQVYLPSQGRRNEIMPNNSDYVAGDNYYLSQNFYAPAGFDLTASGGSKYQVIEQMRQESTDGSPVMALELRGGNLILSGGYGIDTTTPARYQYQQTLVTGINTDQRYKLIYRIGPFSTTASATTLDIWVNDTQVLTNFTIPPPTLVGGNTYRKLGLYRDPANTTAETLWQAGYAQGTTYADVNPYATPPVVLTPVSSLSALQNGLVNAAMLC